MQLLLQLKNFTEQNKTILNNIFITIVMVLFIILTSIGVYYHEPWFDEAQTWLIAKDLNFWELLKYMKYEGHTFIWYLVLMPFAKLNFQYPLPMSILNLVFAWSAAFIVLKKFPPMPIIKCLIIFSMPLAYQYAVIARPYAIGLVFLFALAALYKKRLERPILYSLLITLCANTSSMALCGAIAFGAIFLYDYFSQKKPFFKTKEFYIIIGIVLFCITILGFQMLGADKQSAINATEYLYTTKNNLGFFFSSLQEGLFYDTTDYKIITFVLPIIFFIVSICAFWKDKRTLFFMYFTYTVLSIIFLKFYNGYQWHHYFYFIYLIISIWIFDKKKSNIWYHGLLGLFIFSLSMAQILTYNTYKNEIKEEYTKSKSIAEYIIANDKLKHSNLVFCDDLSASIVPYLRDSGIKTYDCNTKKDASFFNRKTNKGGSLNSNRLKPEIFDKFTDKDTYIVFHHGRYNRMKNPYYNLELEYCTTLGEDFQQYCIMKITNRKNNE